MFDVETARLLRSAPEVPGLSPSQIPSLLTGHYARLVSARLRGSASEIQADTTDWTLPRIADTYELVASLHTDHALRRAAAFVAGTAQQILARETWFQQSDTSRYSIIDRDRLDPALAAPLLFLLAEQYADAYESASTVSTRAGDQLLEATILEKHIVDLSQGRLPSILKRGEEWRTPKENGSLDERAISSLLEVTNAGLELLAAEVLRQSPPDSVSARFDSAAQAFERVLELSASSYSNTGLSDFGGSILTAYAGPHHLASLLLATTGGLHDAALTSVSPPNSTDPYFWNRWLSRRAQKFPFVWPNHREAISKGFHEAGNSAVVVLPTGAGKTTVSSLKIAGALARGESVVFLVPTHALVDQLTEDLQEIFPKQILGSVVSSDFDLLFESEAKLQEVEVMTPERCLAMLSFAPQAFENVGLLVFDECHLLSPESGKIRRALDGMLCVLGFQNVAPSADLLFLSAMIKNGKEFSEWVEEFTGRPCIYVDLLWKPSRQARGVVIYRDDELETAKQNALNVQHALDSSAKKEAGSVRKGAAEKLAVTPWAIWGLQHNWLDLDNNKATIITSKIQDAPVPLAGALSYGSIRLKPNANRVAASIAITAARNGLKSIVFVNTKMDAVSTANQIAADLNEECKASFSEKVRWEALKAELGDLKHSALSGPAVAVPHNSAMLRLERILAESMFRRSGGAKVIVATPTLAQGLNLPAELAILAGDKRSQGGVRESLQAHEILNAAARAGRAGHLANGVVLLVPEPIMEFSPDGKLSFDVVKKLESVLPEDDRCVTLSDPLEIVLDRLMEGETADPDVRYTINRMAAMRGVEEDDEAAHIFNVKKSWGAYVAHTKGVDVEFDKRMTALRNAIEASSSDSVDEGLAQLATKSGLSTDLLSRLETRLKGQVGNLPTTITAWVRWTIQWLSEDDEARLPLLQDAQRAVLGAAGRKKDGELVAGALKDIEPGILDWIRGKPICDIEKSLGGAPESKAPTKRMCPRARELVGSVIPRSFSYILGLIAHIVERLDPFDAQEELSQSQIESLAIAVRKGYDDTAKLQFAADNKEIISRVQVHEAWVRVHGFED